MPPKGDRREVAPERERKRRRRRRRRRKFRLSRGFSGSALFVSLSPWCRVFHLSFLVFVSHVRRFHPFHLSSSPYFSFKAKICPSLHGIHLDFHILVIHFLDADTRKRPETSKIPQKQAKRTWFWRIRLKCTYSNFSGLNSDREFPLRRSVCFAFAKKCHFGVWNRVICLSYRKYNDKPFCDVIWEVSWIYNYYLPPGLLVAVGEKRDCFLITRPLLAGEADLDIRRCDRKAGFRNLPLTQPIFGPSPNARPFLVDAPSPGVVFFCDALPYPSIVLGRISCALPDIEGVAGLWAPYMAWGSR